MLAAVCVGDVSVGIGGGDGPKVMLRVGARLQLSFTPSLNKLEDGSVVQSLGSVHKLAPSSESNREENGPLNLAFLVYS